MSQKTETICDQCGARKGETNHWFFGVVAERSFVIYANSTRVPDDRDEKLKDFCSHSCVLRALGEFFDSVDVKRKMELTGSEGDY